MMRMLTVKPRILIQSSKFIAAMALALITVGAVASDSGPTLKVSSLELEGEGHERQVRIETSTKAPFTVFRLNEPTRIVIDITGADVRTVMAPEWDDPIVEAVSTRQFSSNGMHVGRVMLSFGVDVEYRVQGDDSGITVFVATQGEIFETVSDPVASVSDETPEVAVKAEVQVETTEPATERPTAAATVAPKVKETKAVEAPAIAPAGKVKLSGIERRGEGRDSSIVLKLNGPAEPKVERIEGPARLIIDLPDVERGLKTKLVGLDSPYVTRARLGDHPTFTRVVLDLRDVASTHQVKKGPEGLVVTMVSKLQQQADAPRGGPESAVSITGVDVDAAGIMSSIRVTVDPSAQYRVDTRSKSAWVLEFVGIGLDASLEKTIELGQSSDVLRSVVTYIDGDLVRVVANLKGPAQHRVRQLDSGFSWDFRGLPGGDAVASSGVARTAAEEESAEEAEGQVPSEAAPAEVAATEAPEAVAEPATVRKPAKKKRQKRRITLDMKNADIVNVLRLLSDVSGENIVAGDEVAGSISIKLNNVPWDRALDTILSTKGYGRIRTNNIIRVAKLETLRRERELELARRQAAAAVEKTAIKLINVNYADSSEIINQLQSIVTERGKVQQDSRTNTIIVEDVISNLDRVVELTKRLDRQTPQVLIEARIVEASSSSVEELGIQWGGSGGASAADGTSTGLVFPGDIAVEGAASDAGTVTSGTYSPSRYAVNLPAAVGTGAGGGIGMVFGSAGGSQLLALRLTAMEESGTGKIISSPRITTLDNRTARIAQGIDIPISTVSQNGTDTKFIPANLELEVTPHVTNDGSILMKIKTEKNEPDFARTGASGDPTIVKKFAETEVLVSDGDTTVIGGIYTRSTSESEAGVPFFSKIPFIGWMFKSSRSEDSRAELLIFITPRIVNRDQSLVKVGPGSTGGSPL
ncbi:MAG: type IV pilus secretin PilQ [Myxococcota bacterium]|nr:type IV pilus secretin PilQ [Myxococcota bacterium]